ncbi:MAG: ATP-binding protein [Lachnospiraceae bacterium]|nr:ATP-binding protein [Lachnospiraceae bacterium]
MKRSGALVQKKYMEYLVSTLAYTLSIYLATIVDGILVGQLMGPLPLTAINLTMPVVYVKNIIFMLFINGGSTIAARYLGERRHREVDKLFTLSVFGCMLGYLLLFILGAIFCAPLSDMFSSNGSSRQYVLDYLIPLLAVGPIQAIANGSAAFLRLDGRHRLATSIPIISNVINLTCDYVYIKYFGWGISGAGWATVTGYACGMLLLIIYFKDPTRNLHFVTVHPADMHLLPEGFRAGLPMAIIQGCNALRNYTMNTVILMKLADAGSQVISVCNNAVFYGMMFAEGAATAMSSVCGVLYGEKDTWGVRSVLKRAFMVSMAFCMVIFLLLELFPVQFGLLYRVVEPESQAMLARYMRIFVLYILFLAPLYVLRAFYQTTRHTNAATAISILEGAVITVPVFLLLSLMSKDLMWFGNCLGAVISLGIVIAFMQREAQKEGARNYLMLKDESEGKCYEFSIDATEESAVRASEETIRFLDQNGVEGKESNAFGVAAEELCVNISRYAKVSHKEQIDIFIRIREEGVLMKVRDCGILFNPTEFVEDTGEHTTGLSLIRALGCRIEYDRIMGFNTTVITT